MKATPILALALATAAAAGANFPLGTYVYTGSVMNYKNELCSSADRLTVQAVAQDGTILASGRVVDPAESSGVNYRLEVPVSSQASGKSAAIGDELNCVVLSGSGTTNVAAVPFPPVERANAIARVNLVSASAKAFTDGDDGETVLVSDEYLDEIAAMMKRKGKTEYDPFADWDGDGASNYAEYKSGTNPFDPSDRLRITEFERDAADDDHLIEFEYAGGHLYAVDASPTLTNRAWRVAPFKTGSSGGSVQTDVWFPGNEYEDVGTATLYVAPAADSPSMFYTIRVK